MAPVRRSKSYSEKKSARGRKSGPTGRSAVTSTTKRDSKTTTQPRKRELYEVECILCAEVHKTRTKNGQEWMYLVKWFNFPDSANSWEQAKQFQNDIVKRFWAEVLRIETERIELMEKTGEPNPREYGTGKRFTPSDKWLNRQKNNAAEANTMPEASPKKTRAKRRR